MKNVVMTIRNLEIQLANHKKSHGIHHEETQAILKHLNDMRREYYSTKMVISTR